MLHLMSVWIGMPRIGFGTDSCEVQMGDWFAADAALGSCEGMSFAVWVHIFHGDDREAEEPRERQLGMTSIRRETRGWTG